jgi:DNA-directed RNA polymerase specialized sigma24 family protein
MVLAQGNSCKGSCIASEGQEQTLGTLHEECVISEVQSFVLAMARRIAPNVYEDLAQEAFLELTKTSRTTGVSNLRARLRCLCAVIVLRTRRSRDRRLWDGGRERIYLREELKESEFMRDENSVDTRPLLRHLLLKLNIARLPRIQRECLWLRYKGLSFAALAEKYGTTLAWLRLRTWRDRQKFLRAIVTYFEIDESDVGTALIAEILGNNR